MTPAEIAQRIARNDHSYQKHVEIRQEFDGVREQYGRDTGVRDEAGYENHIKQTLENKDTVGFIKSNGQEQYYNETTNTFVGTDEHGKGSCFRPPDGIDYIKGELQDDIEARQGKSGPETLTPGGHAGLESQRQEREQRSQSTDQAPARDGEADVSRDGPSTDSGSAQGSDAQAAPDAPSQQQPEEAMPERSFPPPPPPPPAPAEENAKSQGRGR